MKPRGWAVRNTTIPGDDEMTDDLVISLTGSVTLIFDLEGCGPMELRLIGEQKDAQAILRTVLKIAGSALTVDSYTKRHEATLKKLLPSP